MSYCPQCGSTIDHGDRFCRDCGTHLAVQQATHSVRRKPGTAEWCLLLSVVLLLAVAAGVLIDGLGREGLRWPWPATRWTDAPSLFPFGFTPPTNITVV